MPSASSRARVGVQGVPVGEGAFFGGKQTCLGLKIKVFIAAFPRNPAAGVDEAAALPRTDGVTGEQ